MNTLNHNHPKGVALTTALEHQCPACTERIRVVTHEVPDFWSMHPSAQSFHWKRLA